MTLVLRKLLASSTFAIAGALTSISNRLKLKLGKQESAESLEDELDQDYEALDETADEWTEDTPEEEPLSDADIIDTLEDGQESVVVEKNGTVILKKEEFASKNTCK